MSPSVTDTTNAVSPTAPLGRGDVVGTDELVGIGSSDDVVVASAVVTVVVVEAGVVVGAHDAVTSAIQATTTKRYVRFGNFVLLLVVTRTLEGCRDHVGNRSNKQKTAL